MLKTFKISFRLRNTYKVNGIIYAFQQIPFFGKIFTNSLYHNQGIKILANMLAILFEIGSTFLGKLLYFLLFYLPFSKQLSFDGGSGFLHVFVFLTIIGSFLNTKMFDPSKDKYYALFLLQMNAKEYVLTDYFYFLAKVLIGFLPFTLLFGLMMEVPLFICILLPFFVVFCKTLFCAYYLHQSDEKIKNENQFNLKLGIALAFLLILAYLPPMMEVLLPSWLFYGVFVVALLLFIKAILYIIKYDKYRHVYQLLLAKGTDSYSKQSTEAIQRQTYAKMITVDTSETSNKKGYAYFHDLFMKRHKKLLLNSALKITAVILAIFVTIAVIVLMQPDLKKGLNTALLTCLPYFLFVMYLINRGQTITQAMFMNCDSSMLTYRFYREPKDILRLFHERLKTLIYINGIPGIVLAFVLPALLFLSGGTSDFSQYLIMFFSIASMSIFFSVHHLILYYLLQPYNVHVEAKSMMYSLANGLTYFICYYIFKMRMPSFTFGICMITFAVVYSLFSLWLVYHHAPKTFKLRT